VVRACVRCGLCPSGRDGDKAWKARGNHQSGLTRGESRLECGERERCSERSVACAGFRVWLGSVPETEFRHKNLEILLWGFHRLGNLVQPPGTRNRPIPQGTLCPTNPVGEESAFLVLKKKLRPRQSSHVFGAKRRGRQLFLLKKQKIRERSVQPVRWRDSSKNFITHNVSTVKTRCDS
jgi:hypothetical protein